MTNKIEPKIKFVGLHAHSTFSTFDGFGYPDEHIDFALENGMNSLALTDHGSMNGFSHQFLYSQKLKEKGINFKPIFGVEAYFHPSIKDWKADKERIAAEKKDGKKEVEEEATLTIEDETTSKTTTKHILNKRRHMVLLAQNQTGLTNIFKMVSLSYQGDNYYRFPRIDYELLEKYGEGVIASSACLGGIYAGDYWDNFSEGKEKILEAMRETTRKMMKIFGDRWYGELQWNGVGEQHAVNQLIIQLSKEFGFKLISTADSHYPRPENWIDRELYKRIGWLNKKDDTKALPKNTDEIGYELYPKNGDQMFEAYKKYSQLCNVEYDEELVIRSIEETHDIAFNRIENFSPDNKVKLPTFVIPVGMTANDALEVAAFEGMVKKKLAKKEVYVDRLNRELGVIKENNFSQYFLTMKAICDKANETMLTGPGRGSGAGSLVAYLLDITQIDPIRWDLQFERFMRSNQTDYPDIDFDVADTDTLKEKLVADWGSDKVAPITNWNTLQLKSLIKDVAKFYDIPFQEVNAVTSKMLIEATPLAKQKHDIKAGVYTPTFDELMEFSSSLKDFLGKYSQIEKHIKALHGMIRSCSRHAGGLVVTENIDSCMPLINSGGTIQTPWSEGQTVRHLEPLGFIKFDILGLETLKMIETAIIHILKRHHKIKNPTFEQVKEYYTKHLHPDVLDFEDQKVYDDVFRLGKWAGIFQFANDGAQKFCVKAKPKNLIDISAITSIYRPGPMCLSGDTKILTRKHSWNGNKINRINGYSTKSIKEVYDDFHNLFDKNGKIKNYQYYISSYDEDNRKIIQKNKIKNVFKSGEKEVFKITVQKCLTGPKTEFVLDDIKSSKDHRFLTPNGWKTLEQIIIGEYILILNKKAWKDRPKKTKKYISGKKNFRNIAFYHHKYECLFCDWTNGSLDVNHIEKSRNENNKPENLCFLCPNHHREWTEGTISREVLLEKQKNNELFHSKDFCFVRFVGKESVGFQETYDIEMEAPHHNFIAGECVVHNSANVPETYVEAQSKPMNIKYIHKLAREVTEDTFGFLIFQEQIASMAHKLGKNISLEEGNQLRKVLTKKGTGKEDKVKTALYQKFIDGCVEKNISKNLAEEQWKTFEYFSGYGFNKSHAVSYSAISFQCAWLLTYFPSEWMAAFLDKTPEKLKEQAINIAKNFGYIIKGLDVNTSGNVWEISEDGKTLIQPLTSIKGLGQAAFKEIVDHRPFKTIEEFIFNEKMSYSKLNKRSLDVLVRSGALSGLMDSRFSGQKHFWSAIAVDRPRKLQNLLDNIEKYRPEGDFTEAEKIEFETTLCGMFPISRVMSQKTIDSLEQKGIPPIAEFDADLIFCWFIPRKKEVKKTKNGKEYWELSVVDSTNTLTRIKCWGIKETDKIQLNRPYISRLDYDPQWGFSSRSVGKNFKLIG